MRHVVRPATVAVAALWVAWLTVLQPTFVHAADAEAMNRRLGRGINLGNALEAPAEGAWGLRLEASFFRTVKEAGFQSVRLPVRWSAHAAKEAPYTIEPAFRARVRWAVDQALGQGLAVVLNVHHYEEIFADPDAHEARLAGLWRQIAEEFRDAPDHLVFELLNEPHARLTPERWNRMIPVLLREVRTQHPDRIVVIGPGGWNNRAQLPSLELPESDRGIIVTFHYYDPFPFTHQGATWVETAPPPVGRRWPLELEETAVREHLAAAAAWGAKHRRPLYVGEFGAYQKADLDSRARWTRAVRENAEAHGMSWAYWEFGSGFGAYVRTAKAWREPLLQALVPR